MIDSLTKKKLLIQGQWVETQEYKSLISPYSGEIIGEIPVASHEDLELAIQSAYKAKNIMAKMPAHQRAMILENLVTLLTERAEEASEIIAVEAAKPIGAARIEVTRTIQTYKFAAEEAKRINGETISLDAAPGGEGRLAYTIHEPIGVVGAITPFNFPMNLVAHKLGPAIASGNTIVLKPASQTPLSAFFIGELLQKAGLPDGALNIITGSGSVIGDKIVTDKRINMITFTGSPTVGINIRNKAGLKRVTLELGSNSAAIIDKGVDINKIIQRCVSGAFSFQGQVCISLQRIYVHEDEYEAFLSKFVTETKKLKLGDPRDSSTDVSALIHPSETERVIGWIQEAKSLGAKVVTGGLVEGGVLQPTVLVEVNPELKVSCQEVFGPVVIIDKFSSIDQAIDKVNDSRFGLQAGVYTGNIHTALDAVDKLHVGGVMINDIPTFRVDQMPYGGVKESGMGREGIKYAIEEMTELKLVVLNRN
ncbi:aldehyde dehydrogenase family protein [Neobacillus sp. OS1-2]|uniref:aldehyde dehydrogenase family protein n=1 Tax=Neobacillus sp. OS1-2 TaxID=3070680 RepID=UPI0027DFB26D|nr:aldehyde dehydrogenase family protein [Neobacillus sp. OS1-2]WML39737.1 aldehyde dehydrogenase family protein [Neobacillus sp. OS1-2]